MVCKEDGRLLNVPPPTETAGEMDFADMILILVLWSVCRALIWTSWNLDCQNTKDWEETYKALITIARLDDRISGPLTADVIPRLNFLRHQFFAFFW